MSLFVTKLAVALEELKSILPAGSDIEAVKWNGKEIELTWNNRDFATPFTHATEWPIGQLQARSLPPNTVARERVAPPPPAPPPAAPVPTAEVKPVGRRGSRVIRQQAT